jgi:aralkylamine N-acetyltransferase
MNMKYEFLVSPTDEVISEVMEIYKSEGWYYKGDTIDLYRRMINGSHCFVVAKDNERIVAMGRAISDKANDAYIQDCAVLKEYRGKGIGLEIVKRIARKLKDDGLSWIGLISQNNTTDFYEKNGFEVMDNTHHPMLLKE